MSNDERPAVRVERHLPHPIERVWRAITEPDELDCWFVVRPGWTPQEGETFETAGATCRITVLDRPRAFAWEWGVERYRFDLEPDGDGTRLVFVHVFNPDLGPSEQHARGWAAYFARLDAHLAGGHLSEEEAHAAL
jgi:uncharacterized protein YndB with AHSA1/START domain